MSSTLASEVSSLITSLPTGPIRIGDVVIPFDAICRLFETLTAAVDASRSDSWRGALDERNFAISNMQSRLASLESHRDSVAELPRRVTQLERSSQPIAGDLASLSRGLEHLVQTVSVLEDRTVRMESAATAHPDAPATGISRVDLAAAKQQIESFAGEQLDRIRVASSSAASVADLTSDITATAVLKSEATTLDITTRLFGELRKEMAHTLSAGKGTSERLEAQNDSAKTALALLQSKVDANTARLDSAVHESIVNIQSSVQQALSEHRRAVTAEMEALRVRINNAAECAQAAAALLRESTSDGPGSSFPGLVDRVASVELHSEGQHAALLNLYAVLGLRQSEVSEANKKGLVGQVSLLHSTPGMQAIRESIDHAAAIANSAKGSVGAFEIEFGGKLSLLEGSMQKLLNDRIAGLERDLTAKLTADLVALSDSRGKALRDRLEAVAASTNELRVNVVADISNQLTTLSAGLKRSVDSAEAGALLATQRAREVADDLELAIREQRCAVETLAGRMTVLFQSIVDTTKYVSKEQNTLKLAVDAADSDIHDLQQSSTSVKERLAAQQELTMAVDERIDKVTDIVFELQKVGDHSKNTLGHVEATLNDLQTRLGALDGPDGIAALCQDLRDRDLTVSHALGSHAETVETVSQNINDLELGLENIESVVAGNSDSIARIAKAVGMLSSWHDELDEKLFEPNLRPSSAAKLPSTTTEEPVAVAKARRRSPVRRSRTPSRSTDQLPSGGAATTVSASGDSHCIVCSRTTYTTSHKTATAPEAFPPAVPRAPSPLRDDAVMSGLQVVGNPAGSALQASRNISSRPQTAKTVPTALAESAPRRATLSGGERRVKRLSAASRTSAASEGGVPVSSARRRLEEYYTWVNP